LHTHPRLDRECGEQRPAFEPGLGWVLWKDEVVGNPDAAETNRLVPSCVLDDLGHALVLEDMAVPRWLSFRPSFLHHSLGAYLLARPVCLGVGKKY